MAKRGALDLELDAIRDRLSAAESYIDAVRPTVHFTVDEARALLERIEKLEAAAKRPAPKNDKKADEAKDSK